MDHFYLDTCSIRSLKQSRDEGTLAAVLEASRRGLIKVSVSEIVVYELAKNAFCNRDANLFSIRKAEQEEEFFDCFYSIHKRFSDSMVNIIPVTGEYIDKALGYVGSSQYEFKRTESKDDLRDAIIFATAEVSLTPAETYVWSNDGKLGRAFQSSRYNMPDKFASDIKAWAQQLAENLGGIRLERQTPGGDPLEINPELIRAIYEADSQYGPLLENAQKDKAMRSRVCASEITLDPGNSDPGRQDVPLPAPSKKTAQHHQNIIAQLAEQLSMNTDRVVAMCKLLPRRSKEQFQSVMTAVFGMEAVMFQAVVSGLVQKKVLLETNQYYLIEDLPFTVQALANFQKNEDVRTIYHKLVAIGGAQ